MFDTNNCLVDRMRMTACAFLPVIVCFESDMHGWLDRKYLDSLIFHKAITIEALFIVLYLDEKSLL